MTRWEEKLYFQSVFDAIDQVYQIKKPVPPTISSYEERLRASFNKLIVPDWYNHEYTSINALRKTKSHGHVPRSKRTKNVNDHPNVSTSSSNHSSHLSNGTHLQSYRYRSPSQSWSERPAIRRDSTTSSYDTNGSVINGRRSTTSNGSSASYAPGVQRVAQSSTWYKPRTFATNGMNNGHAFQPPKPSPRYSKMDQERIPSCDSSSSKIEQVRHPIKPRTMAQAQLPPEEEGLTLDISSDADVTLVAQSPPPSSIRPPPSTQPVPTDIGRTDSLRSISSEAESYSSAVLPPAEKNLVGTDSSSYASVNERCLSPSTASYHTARADDTSSNTGYETPTPQIDDDNRTLSSHSSLSDLSHAETIEPSTEDLDIPVVSTAEQKPLHIPSSNIVMENLTTTTTTTTINDSQSLENPNWYDGSLETCIPPANSLPIDSSQIREIPNDEILREVDINAVGDEFFLFSPRDSTTDDEPSSREILEQTSKRIFTVEDKTADDDSDYNYSSTMITNLDDMLLDDEEDNNNSSSDRIGNGKSRRPIQEDILYEVEHENSFSDHSQNTSSIVITEEKTSSKVDANIDYLTSTDSPIKDNNLDNEKQTTTTSSFSSSSPPPPPRPPLIETTAAATTTTTATAVVNDSNILPIYILPPLFTTTRTTDPLPSSSSPPLPPSSSSLRVNTENNFQKWDSFIHQFPDFISPSGYTSKIRHRHYSVGSYYDHKTPPKTIYPNNTYYYLGSAPVSPLSRTSINDNDSHYHHRSYHNPLIYDNVSSNALRRVQPFLEPTTTYSNVDHRQTAYYRSSSVNPDSRTRVITYTAPRVVLETPPPPPSPPRPLISQTIITPPSVRTSSATFPQYEIPYVRPKPAQETSQFSTISTFVRETTIPPLPPRFARTEEQPPVIHPRISRDRPVSPSRTKSFDKAPLQNIYQEIDSMSTDDDQSTTPNADIQFIRGAIERVFQFNDRSFTGMTSESSRHYEKVKETNGRQYPAVEAVQRFYQHKNQSDRENGTSKSHSKSSEYEQVHSEEIDDTFNDIEVDYQNGKSHRRTLDNQRSTQKTSQETQTVGRSTRSTVPPIDIVTEMVVEQEDDNLAIVDGEEGEVIFYDDIEIVEHSTSSYSTSDSETGSSKTSKSSSSSSSNHYSKPVNTSIYQQQTPAPPVPARTSKPSHLADNNNQQPTQGTTNKTYELERNFLRKKFDVNSVNGMLNRTDQNFNSTLTHRLPSARHFAGKINPDDTPQPTTNGHRSSPLKPSKTILPTRSIIADTNVLVKQIQSSFSRNTLRDGQSDPNSLSTSNKDLRTFVSATYSPVDQNVIDDNGIVQARQKLNHSEDQTFKRQARLSKSFHNVSEYKATDQYPKKDFQPQPSKSVEDNLDQVRPRQPKQNQPTLNITSLVSSTSFSALPNSDENARMLSMKWYTGQVSENSEIGHHARQHSPVDLLHGYVSAHSNRETQELLERLQRSNDARIHAALDDIRSRVEQFDASKTQEDLHVFMRYLESRLRDLNQSRSVSNGRGHVEENSTRNQTNGNRKENLSARQQGRQHLRSTGNVGETSNGHQPTPPRRSSQSSTNQENPAVFDDMLNTVLGLPKKGVAALHQTNPLKREKTNPLAPKQMPTNTTTTRDSGKRLFESGTYQDPRLIYDGPKKSEKEEQPLETSV